MDHQVLFLLWALITSGAVGLGIVIRRPAWVGVGTLLTIPYAGYLMGSPDPMFYLIGGALPLLQIAIAIAVYRQVRVLPWVLFAAELAMVGTWFVRFMFS